MDLKFNINRVHSNTKEVYKNTEIKEKSDKEFGNYFEMDVVSENKNLKIVIKKQDIEGNTFTWRYYSNPLDKQSILVERISTIDTIKDHIKDIFDKNRFDSDYLKNI